MMKRLGIVATAAIFLVACSNSGNSYDKAIDEVIKLENEALKEPGVKKDIDSLKREKACTKVFDEGNVITISYEIRINDSITKGYKLVDEEYQRGADEDDLKSPEPVFVENEDLCQN